MVKNRWHEHGAKGGPTFNEGINVQSFYKCTGWLPVPGTELNIGEIMVS